MKPSPEAVSFDPHGEIADSHLERIIAGPAAALTAVALVAGRRARASGWAAEAAVALARRWPVARRVILADLDFEQPQLHERVGVQGDPGLVDVLDFGLTPASALQPVDDGAWELLPAGLHTADAGSTLRSAFWRSVLLAAASRRATLLLHVPADSAGLAHVLSLAGATLILAEEHEVAGVVEGLEHPYSTLAALVPPARDQAPDEGRPEPSLSPDQRFEQVRLPSDPSARAALIAELRSRQREARLAPDDSPPARQEHVAEPVAGAGDADLARTRRGLLLPDGASDLAREARLETAADEGGLEVLPPRVPRTRRSRHQRPLFWTLLIAFLMSMLAGAWHFTRRWRVETAPSVTGSEAATTPLPAPSPDAPAPYYVAVEAHRDLSAATTRTEALAGRDPRFSFHVAPLLREGTLFYHVFAGPRADSAAAVALRDSLLAARIKTGTNPTDIRHLPLAFLIGDYSSADDARAQTAELRRLDLPSYVVAATAADGALLYRVHVGAFSTEAEADVVRQMLRSAGVRDSLVLRVARAEP